MLKQSISVKDQFGVKHAIQATVDKHFANTQSSSIAKFLIIYHNRSYGILNRF